MTATLALELLSLHLPSEESTLSHRGYTSLLSALCICMGMGFNGMIKIYKVQVSNWKRKLECVLQVCCIRVFTHLHTVTTMLSSRHVAHLYDHYSMEDSHLKQKCLTETYFKTS